MKIVRPQGRLALLTTSSGTRTVRVLGSGKLPAVMCLDLNFTETIDFLRDLRIRTSHRARGRLLRPSGKRQARIGWVKNITDFSTMRSISAGAALMLAAEYDRISRLSGLIPATVDIHLWDAEVKATLAGLGFFDLLDLKIGITPSVSGLLIEPMVSGSDANLIQVNEAILALFGKVQGDAGLRVHLASAVTDAVENVRGHAYPRAWLNSRTNVPFWWFTGAADPTGRVTLAIYDQGITIPQALPLKWDVNHLVQQFFGLFSLKFDPDDPKYDGQAIDMAMQLTASSTGLPFRGKGLPKILDIIQACPEGRLRIVSRCGECIYSADGSKTIKTHQNPLLGTYLELEALISPRTGQ
jgi:hypothetical protein